MKKLLLLTTIALVLLPSCKNGSKYSRLKGKPIPVRTIVVGTDDNSSSRTYIGEIGSEVQLPLAFSLGGKLEELNKQSGQSVKKNEVIARVDDTQAKAMLESAKAVLAQAEDGYKRVKPVYEKGGVSEIKWTEINTDLQKARSMYESSKKRYDDCTLRAALNGVVQINNVEVGQTLAPDQRLGTLLDMDRLTAQFTVPENEVGTFDIGQTVELIIPSLDIETTAKISRKDMISTHLAHTYQVYASLDDKQAMSSLLPGMVCKAKITNVDKKGIVVPSSCVVTQKRGLSVWTLKQGKAQRVYVQISEYVKNGVIVTDGIENGDTVVVQGFQKLFNGANVEILDNTPEN